MIGIWKLSLPVTLPPVGRWLRVCPTKAVHGRLPESNDLPEAEFAETNLAVEVLIGRGNVAAAEPD